MLRLHVNLALGTIKRLRKVRFAAFAIAIWYLLGIFGNACAQTQGAVEYYHPEWNYYFVSSSTDEIVFLDNGGFGGTWKRTGQVFDVWPQPVDGSTPTCRFFSTSFAPKSSHFYTPFADECAKVKTSSDWLYENVAFHVRLTDWAGYCPTGTTALYRVYNNGMGGAPNHRYTTSIATLSLMRTAGWVLEGYGDTGAIACAPTATPNAKAAPVLVFPNTPEGAKLPPADVSWIIQYNFLVPALPTSGTWDPTQDTFYVWGDIDFDDYGRNGAFKISDYVYNQIVPQVFIGQVLAGNDEGFNPSWKSLPTWAIQAQYYWYSGSKSYAQTGSIVNVDPGEAISTLIRYEASTGKVLVSIASPRGQSTIVIERPFPNESSLFASWADFFQRAQQKSGQSFVTGNPVMAVEPYSDRQTLCSILPFYVDSVSLPNIPASSSKFRVWMTERGFSCTRPPVLFGF